MEVHEENDQFFRFDAGEGKVIVGETEYSVTDGDAIVVPAGTQHNVINTSEDDSLKFYTIYAPSPRRDSVAPTSRVQELKRHRSPFTTCWPSRAMRRNDNCEWFSLLAA